MRTTFRRELKKVQGSKRTGTGGDTYEPTLWYFDLLWFTAQSETGRKGRSTDEGEDNFENGTVDAFAETDNNGDTEVYEETPLTPFSSMSDSEVQVNLNAHERSTAITPQTSGASSSNSRCQQKNVRQKTNNATAQKRRALLDLAHAALSSNSNETEEEYQVAGTRLGYQLKGIEEHQRIIAEKLISDVMFYVKMGKLTEDSGIHIPSYSRSYPINPTSTNCTQTHGYVPYPRPQRTTHQQSSTYSILPLENPHIQNSESTLSIGEFLHTYQPQEY